MNFVFARNCIRFVEVWLVGFSFDGVRYGKKCGVSSGGCRGWLAGEGAVVRPVMVEKRDRCGNIDGVPREVNRGVGEAGPLWQRLSVHSCLSSRDCGLDGGIRRGGSLRSNKDFEETVLGAQLDRPVSSFKCNGWNSLLLRNLDLF